MSDFIFLDGVALANYRGIGRDLQLIGPFSRFNFFIGPNNSGKSCVLNYIAKHLNPLVLASQSGSDRDRVIDLNSLDIHLGAQRHQVVMGVGVPVVKCKNHLISKYSAGLRGSGLVKLVDAIYDVLAVNDCLWVGMSFPDKMFGLIDKKIPEEILKKLSNVYLWRDLWSVLTNMSGGDFNSNWFPDTCRVIISNIPVSAIGVSIVPAIRQISPAGESFSDLSGGGLIDELARLQNPDDILMRSRYVKKFERINSFLKTVTECDDAKIEIPHNREAVFVHMNGKVLPLDSLGTGIHEVVMLAAFCTLKEQQIICIEEPEIHLHPLLQRRLVQYLQENTDNQYFVATHSASFIDMPGAAVFHVATRNGSTQVGSAISPSSKFDICRDLGYKASDILQANAIVWVEGPSDRIYIRHWIEALAPDLREGIDYSIMFYGGRLLSHLHASDIESADDDVQSLIAVRQLNRYLAVVIDSDRDRADRPINATKQRVLEEISRQGEVSFGWLTSGREIENYVCEDLMTDALRQCYRSFGKREKKKAFEHVLPFRDQSGKLVKDIDKVKVARAVCSKKADLDVLDLREQITKMVDLIRRANR